ncbi:MAG: hypothetical protein RQ753_07130 [Desulfurivibrionaceae bacterium]|nr:hypothetical protein [Desulfobulbales bacterium]MDT8335454.1 hypothetical protein [Desulfurivibrionaceae bacterium]
MKAQYFIYGVLVALFFLVLTGAIDHQGSSTSANLSFGRYQLSSWATSFGEKGGAVGAFVIDTVSGETRTVYSRTFGPPMESTVIKNDLKKPYSAIQ